jgi:hypothetical protein
LLDGHAAGVDAVLNRMHGDDGEVVAPQKLHKLL